MSNRIRVRFAPSPTGPLHIGGVRTALYNYLFAKQKGGDFILRIEDTDQNRFVEGAEDYIAEALAWLGVHPDEGVFEGGEAGPYRQSERRAVYKKYALQLIDMGYAYYAFDTPEELEALRHKLQVEKASNPVYDHQSRLEMKNSLTLDPANVRARLEGGDPFVVRLKIPEGEHISFSDLVRGTVTVESSNLDDKILLKSDGMPTYHLANVVDDHHMKISHVIRGEEWLPSTPIHVLLYRFLGWQEEMPEFAHLPLLLKPDGKGKLSKRHADKQGYPVFPLQWTDPETGEKAMGFREEGYLPEAMTNFLAFLGWNPGTEQEIFDMEGLIEAFSIDRIGKSGARFDIEKARWYNEQYIKSMDEVKLAGLYRDILDRRGLESTPGMALAVCRLMKERVAFPQEIWSKGRFFFERPTHYDEKVVNTKWRPEVAEALDAFASEIAGKESIQAAEASTILASTLERFGMPMGKVLQALRVALTGEPSGPDLMGIIEVLGAPEAAERIRIAIENIRSTS
jgi:glutamyl-tRNA synthetase